MTKSPGENLHPAILHHNVPIVHREVQNILSEIGSFLPERKEFCVVQGHKGQIHSLFISLDGKFLVTACEDQNIYLWDAKEQRCLMIYKGHEEEITCISLFDKYILSGDESGEIRVWNKKTGHTIHKIKTFSPIKCLSTFPDHPYFVSGGNQAQLWDLNTYQCKMTYRGHDKYITTIRMTDKVVIAGSEDGSIYSWEQKTGKKLQSYDGHYSTIHNLCLNKQNTKFFTCSEDGTIRKWSMSTGKCLLIYKHEKPIIDIWLHREKKQIYSLDVDGGIIAWSTSKTSSPQYYFGLLEKNSRICFSQNQKIIAIADGKNAKLIQMKTGKQLALFQGHEGNITDICFEEKDNFFITASRDHTIRIWSISSGKCVNVLKSHTDVVSSVCCRENMIISTGYDGFVKIWYLEGELLWSKAVHSAEITNAAISNNGVLLFVAERKPRRNISVWNLTTKKKISIMRGHDNTVLSLSMGEKYLASGGADNAVYLWDIKTGECIFSDKHKDWVIHVDLSKDDKRLLVASKDGTAKLWDLEEKRCLHAYRADESCILDAAMEKNSDFIAFIKYKGAEVWQKENCIFEYPQQKKNLKIVGDGEYIFTSESSGYVHLWDKDFQIQKSCCCEMHNVHSTFRVENFLYLADDEGVSRISLKNGETERISSFTIEGKIAITSDQRYIILSKGKDAEMRNLENGEWLRSFRGHKAEISCMIFNKRGNLLFTGASDGIVRKWNTRYSECLLLYETQEDFIHFMLLDPMEDCLFIACGKTIQRWNVSSRVCLAKYEAHMASVHCLCLDRTGKLLVSAGDDCSIRVWDTESSKCRKVIQTKSPVILLELTKDGKLLLSAHKDKSIFLWDVGTGMCLRNYREFSPICGMFFGEEEHNFFVCQRNGIVSLWQIETNEKIASYYHLKNGFAWFTSPEDCAPYGWLWTNSSDSIFFSKADREAKSKEEFLTLYHRPDMVQMKIGDQYQYKKTLDRIEQKKQAKSLEWLLQREKQIKKLCDGNLKPSEPPYG